MTHKVVLEYEPGVLEQGDVWIHVSLRSDGSQLVRQYFVDKGEFPIVTPAEVVPFKRPESGG